MTMLNDQPRAVSAASRGAPILELSGITKEFPNVRALNNVSLQVYPGEVLALIGENGAGKSTMLRILNGDYHPDGGEVRFNGEPVRFHSPRDAQAKGVRVIYQEPEIVPDLTVAENLYLNELPRRLGRFIDWGTLFRQAEAQIDTIGFETGIKARSLANRLSPAQRQLVEILRALKANVRVLALDEPTSSLSEEETNRLFEIVNRLRQDGVAIIYVSHRLREIVHLADRVAILRDGEMVTVQPASDLNETDMMSLMVGRPLSNLFSRTNHTREGIVLRATNLTNGKLRGVSFDLRRGEVLGVSGLIGAGRTVLGKTLFGAIPHTAGSIEVEEQRVDIRSTRDAMNAGIGYAPEDRKGEALLRVLSVRENASLAILREISTFRFVNSRKELKIVRELTERMRVKTPSLGQQVGKLSGGNQQKVVLARWLARNPRVLILDEPTRGIDVGAKAEIYRLIDELASQGLGVILISSELPEILGLSDRIIVMQEGRITGELSAEDATEERILQLAFVDHLSAEQPTTGEGA